MTHAHLNPGAVKKAMEAATLLARAAKLMREAAAESAPRTSSGHYDFLNWAIQIEHVLSHDRGEAGIGPTMQKLTGENPILPEGYYRLSDGTIVSIPENDESTRKGQ